ncbi:MAG: DNA-binding MarR family transcriptional regulator [Paracoccaceae bacterium]|jgi:DNA-binding MarR family transcriptional regulator
MSDEGVGPYFALLYEAAIINQIGTAFLEARLPNGLLASHFGVISHLIRVGDGATPLELARAFQAPKATLTYTLAGLEKHGLVEMRPNPRDKRSKQVWLTPAGKQFRDDALAKLAPLFSALEKRFPPERVAAMLPDLTEFRGLFDRFRNETG